MNQKIFDAHVHLGVWGKQVIFDNLIQPFRGREIKDYKDAEFFMRKNNVSKAIFVPHYKPDQASSYADNYLVVDVTKKVEGAYGGLYFNPEYRFTELVEEHLRLIQDKILVIKMSPDAWPKGVTPDPKTWSKGFRENMEKIIETARNKRLMIQFHTGSGNSDPKNYVPFVNEYGDELRLHFAHMGGSAGGHFRFVPQFIKWLKEGKEFYCDTSYCRGFAPHWLIKKLENEFYEGLKHVFFASDEPWGIFESEYWRVNAVDTLKKIKEMIFYKNAEKAYLKI